MTQTSGKSGDLEEIMYRSGFDNTMSIFLSMRGPLNCRFQGKWYRPLYMFYTCFVEMVALTNYLSIGSRFLSSDGGVLERCVITFPLTSISLSVFRVAYLSLRRRRFARLISGLDRLYPDSERLRESVDGNAKLLRFIPRMMVLLTALPMGPWCFIPILNAIRGGPLVVAVPSSWPFDPVANVYAFSFVSMMQTVSAGYNTLRVVLFDNLFTVYACRQLVLARELGLELRRILSAVRVDGAGAVSYSKAGSRRVTSAWVVSQLRQWVINHQESLRLAEELQTLFSPCLAVQFSLISMSLCTTAFVIVFSNADFLNIALCFLYAIGNSLALLITCRIGDLITNESEDLEHAVDGTYVHLLEPHVYKYWLKNVLTRARQPIRLSAFGVYPLNTETFKSIMVTTYSFFTLLINMKERQE